MRKRGNREHIFIDLTTLLDVTLIVLLVVIFQMKDARADADDAADMAAQMQEAKNETDAARELYEEQIKDLGTAGEYIVFIRVSCPYDEDPKSRRIMVLNTDDTDTADGVPAPREIAAIRGTETGEGDRLLEEYLRDVIAGNTAHKTIVLSLNEDAERILYRDQKRIAAIIDELAAENPDVRLAGG